MCICASYWPDNIDVTAIAREARAVFALVKWQRIVRVGAVCCVWVAGRRKHASDTRSLQILDAPVWESNGFWSSTRVHTRAASAMLVLRYRERRTGAGCRSSRVEGVSRLAVRSNTQSDCFGLAANTPSGDGWDGSRTVASGCSRSTENSCLRFSSLQPRADSGVLPVLQCRLPSFCCCCCCCCQRLIL
jgi:hypothetical protein